jgi:hypothetical protein
MLRASLSRNPPSSLSTAATLSNNPTTRHSLIDSASATFGTPTTNDDTTPANTKLRRSSSSASPPAAATSESSVRARKAELENDELRRALEKERGIAERLKREGAASELSPEEAQLRVLQLKREVRDAGAASVRRSTTGMFKAACSTDLLFLIDTTGSMESYINAAKLQVRNVVKNIKATFFNDAEVRIAIVAYKDHNDYPNIQFLDFTPSTDQVHSFLDRLVATGGGDPPEDVLGGIRQALNATWLQQTRCIIHIADAPPHGRTLHDMPDSSDNWPNPGGEPHGLTHGPLLRQMVNLNINYGLLRISGLTDRMALSFAREYAAASADCKLHKSNRYYSQSITRSSSFRGWGSPSRKANSKVLFEEAELGTAYSALQHLILKAVTTSASRTAVRMSAARSRNPRVEVRAKIGLLVIEEDDGVDDDNDAWARKMETTPPQWDTLGWLDDKLVVEGFSPDVIVHNSRTLNDMMDNDDNIKMSVTDLTIHRRSRPFAQGAVRLASYARTAASTNRFVVKSFKRGGKQLAHFAEDMRAQALCKAFALEFNGLVDDNQIDFIVTICLKSKSKRASGECMSLEPFIEGVYVKYNGNNSWVNDDNPNDPCNQAAQAFSHFTFERSKGRFLVCDLQGVGNKLTDPAIHTRDRERFKLADTNLNEDGFKFFFSTHVCNGICRKLGLKTNGAMIMSGKYIFTHWSTNTKAVCCSNKLCGTIVRLARAKRSDKFPGYHWCDTCRPQLELFTVKRICVAPGPHHEFDVSTFFEESQGRTKSRKCPEHRQDGVAISKTRRSMSRTERAVTAPRAAPAAGGWPSTYPERRETVPTASVVPGGASKLRKIPDHRPEEAPVPKTATAGPERGKGDATVSSTPEGGKNAWSKLKRIFSKKKGVHSAGVF